MIRTRWRKLSDDELVHLFEHEKLLEYNAKEALDVKRGNAAHDRARSVYRELKARGPDGQEKLLVLLGSDNVLVRLGTAFLALEFAPDAAVPVLEHIALTHRDLYSFEAKGILAEWRKGGLDFPT